MNTIRPEEQAIRAFADAPDDKPFVMVNLLKFKKDGGEAEYAEYGASAMKMVQETGGRIFSWAASSVSWSARADGT